MNVLIFGATGMVGQGVLRECLLDNGVESVLCIGRTPSGVSHPKLQDVVLPDLFDIAALAPGFAGFDACFFCLGVSSVGLPEENYRRITYELTLAVATVLARTAPRMAFVYVSGAGTDSSERGPVMWARVKGATENALMRLPFRAAYMFRPGLIRPLHGARSKTALVRWAYRLLGPVLGLAQLVLPGRITTTQKMGRAMLAVARHGAPSPIVEAADIHALG